VAQKNCEKSFGQRRKVRGVAATMATQKSLQAKGSRLCCCCRLWGCRNYSCCT